MTQRGLPPIDPSDLRDHATPERIDRVWRRVAADISHGPVRAREPRPRYWVTVLAATLAAFAVGLLVGKGIAHPAGNEPVVAVSSSDITERSEPVEVFAAGTQGRHFSLPGGGTITLSPGSTVELIDHSGSSIRLRLVQGEAAVDTAGAAPSQLFDILAEDAVLSTRTGGALRVRRTADDLDVSVSNGQVDVRSPTGTHSLHSGEEAQALPIRGRTAAVRVPVARPRASSPREFAEAAPRLEATPAPAGTISEWRVKSSAGDFAEARRLLDAQPGGVDAAIASATSPAELMEINDVVVQTDPAASMRALTRIVDHFPSDGLAQIAAYKLGRMYEKAGQPEQARTYFERVQGALAEDAACQRIRAATLRDEAVRAANEYLGKYPEGRCRDEAERAVAGDNSAAEDDPVPVPSGMPAPDAGSH